MKKIVFFFIVILVFLSSCVTQRKCLEKFPPTRDTIRIVQVHDSIVYRDTTIVLTIPGETRVDSVPIPCPPPQASFIPDTAKAETPLANAKAWWNYPNIQLKLEQKDTTVLLKAALKEAYHWKSEYEKVTTVPEPVKYIPKIYKQALSICIFIFAAAFLFVGWKAYKFFKK
jgi:hypothetical protein